MFKEKFCENLLENLTLGVAFLRLEKRFYLRYVILILSKNATPNLGRYAQ
jgi:hypothetical protein